MSGLPKAGCITKINAYVFPRQSIWHPVKEPSKPNKCALFATILQVEGPFKRMVIERESVPSSGGGDVFENSQVTDTNMLGKLTVRNRQARQCPFLSLEVVPKIVCFETVKKTRVSKTQSSCAHAGFALTVFSLCVFSCFYIYIYMYI